MKKLPRSVKPVSIVLLVVVATLFGLDKVQLVLDAMATAGLA